MTDLLEREGPLRDAQQALQRSRGGQGATLLVSGEAGIGKSSLIQALAAGLKRHHRVFRGGCENLFSPRPLGPLRDIALVQRGALLRALDEGAPADTVFAAFLELLNTPGVCSLVVFEDLHWADEATLDLIRHLARRIVRLPVLLLLSYRDDEVGPEHPLQAVLADLPPASVTRVPLQPLSPAAVADMATRADRPAAGLHAATGGNPFYVTEVLASGVTDADRGVPSSVRDAVHARLARLNAEQRGVLDALCVSPGRVEPWLARSLLSA
ncbi:MAG TPA: AAA family ATPase, partial [Albitalea sp.]|nr:AAA family ATPase [Albitalea sp.]